MARLQKELCDTKDALEILKSYQYPEKMTQALYRITDEYVTQQRRYHGNTISVSRILKILEVSRVL